MAGKEVVKGTFGNESIELNNAATEATLMALLKLAQKDSAILAQMAKQAGIDAKKIEDSLEKSKDSGGGGGGGGLNFLGGAANLAGGFLMDMVGGITKTIGNLAGFADALMDGTARASDFFKAFKDLPLGLGFFAQLLAAAQKFYEVQIDTYRKISETGAGLTGSLVGLRIQALTLGLSMDQFAGMFAKNQKALAALGANAARGAQNLVAINTQLINSNLGHHLMGLGYTFEQINGLIGDYLAVTADGVKVNRSAASEQARLAKAAGEYGKELDFLSRLTGESREALQQKMAADAQEASWKMYLAGLPEEQQKLAAQAVERARLLGGKGGVDAIKAMFVGFAGPFSQEGQTFVATMNGGTRALRDMVTAVKSGQKSTTVMTQLDNLLSQGISDNIKDLAKSKNAIYAMGQGSEGGAKAMLEITEAMNVYTQKGMTEASAIRQAIIDARAKAEVDAKAAKAQAEMDLAMKQLGAKLVMALQPMITKLAEIGRTLIDRFMRLVDIYLPDIEHALEQVAAFIEQAFRDPDAAWAKISGWFKGMLAKMLEAFSHTGLGRILFGDAAESLGRQSKIEELHGLDEIRMRELIGKTNKTEQEQAELESMKQTISEGRKALADEMRDKAKGYLDDSKINDAVVSQLAEKYHKTQAEILTAAQNSQSEIGKDYLKTWDDVKQKQKKKQEEAKAEADKIEKGDIPLSQYKNKVIAEFASGTPGSGKGILQDFGRESVAKLHGREAVLTEEQLTNLAKGIQQQSSGPVINAEINNSDLVVEHLIQLNRQAAMQNKILNQMVENQRTMINRSTGNRLMV